MLKPPRKYGQLLVALLVTLAAVLVGGWLYMNKGGVTDVLVVSEPIPAGHPITEADVTTSKDPVLVSRSVSGVADAIPVSDVEEVYGKRTAVALVPGQVLTYEALTTELLPEQGKRVIAVSIPGGRVPQTLEAGAVVDVVAVPQSGEAGDTQVLDDPRVISAAASVYGVTHVEDGSVVVTLLITETDARQVAAYGSVGRLTLMQAPIESGEEN